MRPGPARDAVGKGTKRPGALAPGLVGGGGSERDVVLLAAGPDPDRLLLGGEAIRGGLLGGLLPALALLAFAEELDGVGDDLDRLALVAVFVDPLAPLQPALDRDRPALRQVLLAALAAGAPDGEAESAMTPSAV